MEKCRRDRYAGDNLLVNIDENGYLFGGGTVYRRMCLVKLIDQRRPCRKSPNRRRNITNYGIVTRHNGQELEKSDDRRHNPKNQPKR